MRRSSLFARVSIFSLVFSVSTAFANVPKAIPFYMECSPAVSKNNDSFSQLNLESLVYRDNREVVISLTENNATPIIISLQQASFINNKTRPQYSWIFSDAVTKIEVSLSLDITHDNLTEGRRFRDVVVDIAMADSSRFSAKCDIEIASSDIEPRIPLGGKDF